MPLPFRGLLEQQAIIASRKALLHTVCSGPGQQRELFARSMYVHIYI